MTDYIAFMRSNSFKVKDVWAFKKAIEDKRIVMDDVEIVEEEDGSITLAGYCSVPSTCLTSCNRVDDFEFSKFIQKHLVEGQKAVLMEIGYEDLCYLNAFRCVITPERIENKYLSLPEG